MKKQVRDTVALGWRSVAALGCALALAAVWLGGGAVAQDGPAGAMAIRDHLTTGFPLVGAHQNIRCETCHVRGIFKNTPKTCEGCHTPSARVSNVTITTSHVPTLQPCSVCHNQLSFAGAKFNHAGVFPGACASCHNTTNAPGKPSGHVVTASSCDTCHRTSTWAGAGFDHAQVVPGTCASCHNGAVAAGRTPNHIPTTQACDTCHTNTVSFAAWTMNHAGIVGNCTSCHGGGFADVRSKPTTHLPTSASCETCHTSTTTFTLATFKHEGIATGCASCHDGKGAAGKPVVHIPTTAVCESCHRSTTAFLTLTMDHTGIVGGCATCHGGQFADVKTKPPTHLPTAAACETCHSSMTSFKVASFAHTGIVSGCASCHDAKTATGKPAIHIPTTAPCETCHKSTTAFSTLTMDHSGIAAGCATCHGGQFADVRAQSLTAHIPTSVPCETCHKSTSAFSSWTMSHSGIATGCASCHGGKFTDVRTKPPTHLPTAAACETCHTSTSSFKLATFAHTGIASGCASCHDGKTATGKPAVHIPTQAPCETCHKSTTAFSTLAMDHTGIASGCASCHGGQFSDVVSLPAAHIPTNAACESCHVPTKFTNFSGGTMNHAGIVAGCATCHASGKTFVGVTVVTPPATHIPFAGAACESCHAASKFANFAGTAMNHGPVAGIACATCHETGRNWYGVTIVTRPTPAQDKNHPLTGECGACHTSTTSFAAGIIAGKPANHIPTNEVCTLCHSNPANYSVFTMNHQNITSGCATCHASGLSFANIVPVAPPATHVPFGSAACETCHSPAKFSNFSGTAMNHAAVPGVACANCHGTGKSFYGITVVTPPGTHIPFAGAACESCHAPTKFTNFSGTAMNHGPVSSISCATCHETGKTWYGVTIVTRPTPAKDPNHPTGGDCGTCHTSTTSFATGVTGGKPANHIPTSQPCALCHSNPANYQIFAMDHTGIGGSCATCHGPGLSFANIVPKAPPPTHIPYAAAACEACHLATKFTNFAGTAMNHGPVSGIACATCHETGKTWYGVTIVTRPTAQADPNHPPTGDCGTCHTSTTSFATGIQGLPANHIPTAQVCTLCHNNPGGVMKPGVMNHQGIASNCTQCHLAAPTGKAFLGVTPVAQGNNHIPTSASCETCHSGYATFAGGSMNHTGISSGCATCHATGKTFTGVAVVTPPATHIPFAGAACEACHAPAKFTNFGGTAMNHGPVSGITCATCHETGKTWYGVTIVTRPTPAQDPNHPTTGDCGTCHTSTTSFATGIQGLPANHIPTAQVCTLCHNNPGGVMKPGVMNHQGIASNCTQCHLAAPTGKAFLGVTPVAQGNGHIPTSASCEQCHAGFVNFSGGKMNHAGISSGCATCHATGKTFTGVVVVTPPATHIPFAGAACEACHLATKFTNFAGTAMNHGPVSGIACATCHETGKTWYGVTIVTRPTPAQDPNHPTTGDCGTCHTSTTSFATGVQGLPANHVPTAQACTLCHHNPGGVMKPGIMDHQGITSNCTQCHLAAPAGKAFLGVTPVAQGNGHIPTSASCERCHAGFASFGNGKMDHTGISSGCATCHASGKTFTGVTVVTPPATHIPFAGAACEACHAPAKFTNFGGTAMNHAPVTSISCATCHGAGKSWYGVTIVTLPSTGHIPNPSALDCKGCHSSTTSFKTWKMSHSGITTNCVNCHGGQFAGVEKKPNDHPQTSNVCEQCHSINTFSKMLLLPAGKALLIGAAKAPGTIGDTIAAKPGLAKAVNVHIGIAPGSCTGCHNGSTAAAKPGRHLVTMLSCDACHRTTAWLPATYTHPGVAPTTCATCHNGSAASARPASHFVTTRSCDGCHRMTSWRPPMPYRHLSPAYSPHPTVQCIACHKGNSEMVVWRFPAAKPDCAGCHQNMPKPGLKPAVPPRGTGMRPN
ncbi:MAG: hypothetical protein ABI886_05830 [Betaproteobacteria bacterium]